MKMIETYEKKHHVHELKELIYPYCPKQSTYLIYILSKYGASQVVQVVKNPFANAGDTRDMKISWRRKWQSSPVFSAWKIPWTEEFGGL